jgi:hypothetical protein
MVAAELAGGVGVPPALFVVVRMVTVELEALLATVSGLTVTVM